jgi:dTDP-4-dehydro-6-deoxy-alpha-D-gulose 4-ketoreductase
MVKNFWKGKEIIVAGGSGFLGSHFIEELLKLGAHILCIDKLGEKRKFSLNNSRLHLKKIDLVNYSEVIKSIGKADMIVNCAAMDGNTEFKIKHVAEMMDINMRISSNILNAAREKGIRDVVLISTAEIYSPQAKNPIIEEDDYQKYDDFIMNGYVLSKRYSEILGLFYEEQYGINVFSPRLTNTYGPGDHFGDQANRVIPSMIKKALNGEPIGIWGDGSQVRQFIYVKDAVKSILKMVEKNKYHRLNIANGEVISILDMAKLITIIAGVEEKISLDKNKPFGTKLRVLDTAKLNSIIDFKLMSLKKGLKEMIEWYKKEN